MNPRYIAACERDDVNLSFESLLKLCRALQIPPVDLLAAYTAILRADGSTRSHG